MPRLKACRQDSNPRMVLIWRRARARINNRLLTYLCGVCDLFVTAPPSHSPGTCVVWCREGLRGKGRVGRRRGTLALSSRSRSFPRRVTPRFSCWHTPPSSCGPQKALQGVLRIGDLQGHQGLADAALGSVWATPPPAVKNYSGQFTVTLTIHSHAHTSHSLSLSQGQLLIRDVRGKARAFTFAITTSRYMLYTMCEVQAGVINGQQILQGSHH